MESLPQIAHKEEMVRNIQAVFEELHTFLESCSDADLQHKTGETWSISEEFQHVIMSASPVMSALKMPKITFKAFGTPNRPSRSFDELVKRYHEKLDAFEGEAPANFSPKSSERPKSKMQSDWKEILEKVPVRIEKYWKEEEFDKYLAPHPLLGKITVREVLFFTIYHSNYHLLSMQKKKESIG